MTDLFFGPLDETQRERGIRERKAKLVCRDCPVFKDCEEYSLTTSIEDSAVLAGRTHAERNKLRSERELAARRR